MYSYFTMATLSRADEDDPAPPPPPPLPAGVGSGTHLAGNTVYLLTGASSGIGAALLPLLLARPRVTVLALHRPSAVFPAADTSPALAEVTHATSALIPQHYTASMSAADVHWMASGWRDAHGIGRIDVVIAAAGAADRMRSTLSTPWSDVVHAADINLGGPLRLVQGLRTLLGLEDDGDPDPDPDPGQSFNQGHIFPPPVSDERAAQHREGSVFAFLSSSVSSMGSPEPAELAGFAYGASKAAANYLVARLHVECEPQHLTALAIHPGWVRTRMGLDAARDWGIPDTYVPLTPEESARGVLAVVDNATRKSVGGKFVTWEGKEMDW